MDHHLGRSQDERRLKITRSDPGKSMA